MPQNKLPACTILPAQQISCAGSSPLALALSANMRWFVSDRTNLLRELVIRNALRFPHLPTLYCFVVCRGSPDQSSRTRVNYVPAFRVGVRRSPALRFGILLSGRFCWRPVLTHGSTFEIAARHAVFTAIWILASRDRRIGTSLRADRYFAIHLDSGSASGVPCVSMESRLELRSDGCSTYMPCKGKRQISERASQLV